MIETAVREVRVKGVRWLVREDLADGLVEAGALDVWKLAESPSARLVKKGPSRIVFRVSVPHGKEGTLDLFVKSFLLPRLRDLVRYLLRGSRGRKEWRAARALEALGVPTARRVAVGERRVARVLREDCIITEAVPDVTPLDRFVLEELAGMTPAARGRILREGAVVLAQFVRRLHDGGVYHRDFHGGNVLVRDGEDGSRQFMLIDLHRVRCGRALSLGRRLRNLVQLNRFFSMAVPRTARLRFWRAYVCGIPLLEENRKAYARLLEEQTVRSRRAFWKRREKSCLRNNPRFRRFRLPGGIRGHTVRGQINLPRKVMDGIPSRGRLMPDARVLKDSESSRVWEQVLDFGPTVRTIVVKRKVRVGRWKRVRSLLRRVGAMGEWRAAYAMKIRGLPVVETLAAFEKRRLGIVGETWLITAKVESRGNLAAFVEQNFAGRLSEEKARLRRRLARSLARLVRRMHDLGFSQRDLKPSNILVSPMGRTQDGDFRFTLVDLEGMRHRSKTPQRLRVRDLGRLTAGFVASPAVRTTDMMHFLDEYLRGVEVSRERRRTLIEGIRRAVREKLAAWESKRY